MVDILGRHLGSYLLKSRLGQGGMGEVYKAYQVNMDRDVAIEVLPAALGLDPEFSKRFSQEARVIASLEHARILPVHDYGEEDGLAYIVMRLLDGPTLRDKIQKNGALSPGEALRVLYQVAEGLAYAHNQGILHRDLSSNNIMFNSAGDAYITDFGLAKLMGSSPSSTDGGIVGTPEYIAPEVGMGGKADLRSDIYSLGVVLFEMLTGRTPYSDTSPMVVIVKHINEQIPDPSGINPALSTAIAEVVLKATAKDPEDRFQSSLELAKALQAAIRQGDALSRGSLLAKLSPASIAVMVVLLIALAAGLVSAVSGGLAAPPLPPATSTGVVARITVAPTTQGGAVPTGVIPTFISPTGVAPTLSAANLRQILFISDQLHNSAFFVMYQDGTDQSELFGDDANNQGPDYSPDGTQIAYTCEKASRRYVCLVKADGTGKSALTDDMSDNYAPAWSPDGSRIAFVSVRDGNQEIYVMNANGENLTRLTAYGANDFDPAWSPDGKQIVYATYRDSLSSNIWVMNADGSVQTALTDVNTPNYKPGWSPDGKLIVFVSERDGNPNIYTIHIDGTYPVQLTNSDAEDNSPAWSADGKHIVFWSRRDGNAEIYIMDANGENQMRLTNNPTEDVDPVWKP